MSHPRATTPQAEPLAAGKVRIAAAIEAARDQILALSHRIHENPEPAFEEFRASGWVADAIARHGYEVEHPIGSLETALRGVLRGGLGGDRPRIGILAEYDALPGLGHGCGHNSMAASGVGAAIGLAAVRDELPGEIVFLGTPAEERGSGKQFMIDDGLFDGLDAALLYHPSDKDHVRIGLLASVDIDVTFGGRASHAASDPWMGLNALDALVLLFSSIGLWRQQLRPDARVHGIVLEGGTAANIIPDRAVGRFMIRSTDQAGFDTMRERFVALVEAAALATGTRGEAVFSGGSMTMNDNPVLVDLFERNLRASGVEPGPPDPNLGSSDMGNVSWVVPAIHPCLAICEAGTPGHSIEFREAAATPRADDVTLLAATVIAQTSYDLFRDPEAVAATARAFADSRR
jgi:amidohydrolase